MEPGQAASVGSGFDSGVRDARTTTGQYRVWPQSPATFSTSAVCGLKHNFHHHPLMELSELAQLAKALYETRQCRFITPGATPGSKFFHSDHSHDGRHIDDVFRRIEEPGSWVALYDVQTHPAYKGFVDEVIECVRPLVERQQPGIFNAAGFIFISAPPSVTPFHIDRENNFWLQVRGRKTMNVWDPSDRQAVDAEAVEEFILTGGLDEVKLKDGVVAHSHQFDTGPGDGIYFPSTSPHMTRSEPSWTTPGDGVSVSIGVVFYTSVTRRHAHLHALNRVLRKLGASPRAPGHSDWLDRATFPLGRAATWGLKRFRNYESRNGF